MAPVIILSYLNILIYIGFRRMVLKLKHMSVFIFICSIVWEYGVLLYKKNTTPDLADIFYYFLGMSVYYFFMRIAVRYIILPASVKNLKNK